MANVNPGDMAAYTGEIKQVAAGRRRPNMTRKEYNDHRFRIHGALSDTEHASPQKYIQTPIFDAAFGSREPGTNLNHAWFGRGDIAELTFRNWTHLKETFSSDWVKQKVGPDGALFSDKETIMVFFATEEKVSLPYELAATAEDGFGNVAIYWLSGANGEKEGKPVQEKVQEKLVKAIEENAKNEVYKVQVNVALTSEAFDLQKYFGGGHTPSYCLVYKIFMRSAASVPYVRKAQKNFEDLVGEGAVNFGNSFIIFGKEGTIVDHSRNIRYDPKRQPKFDDQEYFNSISHLDLK